VEETVWHEIAHYFGLDEREVREPKSEDGISGDVTGAL